MNESQKYSANEVSSLGQNELESRAFIRTASALNLIKEHWEEKKGELPEALDKNRRLWTIIASAMQESDCPAAARSASEYHQFGHVCLSAHGKSSG